MEEMMINKEEISSDESSTTITHSSWKLYENPFYISEHHHHHYHQQECKIYKHLNCVQNPVAASISDLTFSSPLVDTEFKMAQAQIMKLKAELEYERKARKRLEQANMKLAKEMAEEKTAREALERVCEELARGISSEKAEINRMKRELEEEKKMLRMAEVLRKESVQMKLSDAKIFLEQRLTELDGPKKMHVKDIKPEISPNKKSFIVSAKVSRPVLSELEIARSISLHEKSGNCNDNNSGNNSWMVNQRKASPEPENPHIKRGIKGFVEFPRVLRAVGSKSKRWGSKLECQKAQLRTLLKQKCPIKSNYLVIS